jgi:hypothetical protein
VSGAAILKLAAILALSGRYFLIGATSARPKNGRMRANFPHFTRNVLSRPA